MSTIDDIDSIDHDDVLKALKYIDDNVPPKNRASKSFDLIHNEKKYPPKYVISIASKFCNGFELMPDEFHAHEACIRLIQLNFIISPRSISNQKSVDKLYNKAKQYHL